MQSLEWSVATLRSKSGRIMPHVKTVAYVLLICQSQAPGFMFANNNDEKGLRGFYAASCAMAQTVDFRADLGLCQRCDLTIGPNRRQRKARLKSLLIITDAHISVMNDE